MKLFVQNMLKSMNNYQLSIIRDEVVSLLDERFNDVVNENVRVIWANYKELLLEVEGTKLDNTIEEIFTSIGIAGIIISEWESEIVKYATILLKQRIDFENMKTKRKPSLYDVFNERSNELQTPDTL